MEKLGEGHYRAEYKGRKLGLMKTHKGWVGVCKGIGCTDVHRSRRDAKMFAERMIDNQGAA